VTELAPRARYVTQSWRVGYISVTHSFVVILKSAEITYGETRHYDNS
jgi:hypothetical protein